MAKQVEVSVGVRITLTRCDSSVRSEEVRRFYITGVTPSKKKEDLARDFESGGNRS